MRAYSIRIGPMMPTMPSGACDDPYRRATRLKLWTWVKSVSEPMRICNPSSSRHDSRISINFSFSCRASMVLRSEAASTKSGFISMELAPST